MIFKVVATKGQGVLSRIESTPWISAETRSDFFVIGGFATVCRQKLFENFVCLFECASNVLVSGSRQCFLVSGWKCVQMLTDVGTVDIFNGQSNVAFVMRDAPMVNLQTYGENVVRANRNRESFDSDPYVVAVPEVKDDFELSF